MNKKVLVSGSNGQLGLTIKELSIEHKENIDFVFASKTELDITNEAALNKLFKTSNFDYCINCAAYTNVEQAEKTPKIAFKVNAEAVKIIAKTCKKYNTILIHISTDYVFDGKAIKPYYENTPTNPINKYGESKLFGEKYIQETITNYFIIRTSWLYSIYGTNFLKTIITKIKENLDLNIITSETGTPSSCIDLTNFIFHLIYNTNNADFGIYHFSATGETTWYDFAKHIAKQFKDFNVKKIKPIKNYHSKAERPLYSVLNNSKVLKLVNEINHWKDSVDIMLKKMIKQ